MVYFLEHAEDYQENHMRQLENESANFKRGGKVV